MRTKLHLVTAIASDNTESSSAPQNAIMMSNWPGNR